MRIPPHRLRSQHQATGFTLVEVILALSLASILLAGVYAAIDQSYKLTASGREEMQRAQLARALIRRIELDIRSITFTPPPPEEDATTTATSTTSSSTTTTSQSNSSSSGSGSSSGGGNSSRGGGGGSGSGSSGGSSSAGSSGGGSSRGGSSGSGGQSGGSNSSSNNSSNSSNSSSSSSSSSSTSSSDSTDTEVLPPNSRSLGVRGTAVQMEMSIARPRRDLLPGTGQAAGIAGSSDLRGVTYSFSASGSAMGGGLIRAEGERMAIEQVEASGGLATQVSQIQVLAPEVIAVNFRYFDGHMWQTAWDSETNGRLPRAIEIMMQLRPPQQKSGYFSVAVSRSMETFRTVVLIPVSDPFPPEFLE